MERLAEKKITYWLKGHPRKPLIIRGARQVGKSTLVRNFAAKNDLVLNEVNLERHSFLDEVFKSTDTNKICRELEAVVGRNILEPGSILFLDEIQAAPHAIMALRYFFEDVPDLPLIAAGSLLEFTLSDHAFSMPVGRVEYLHLYPMSFAEFLLTLEPALLDHLRNPVLQKQSWPLAAQQKLQERQRQYFFVGGMPEAVKVYQEKESLSAVTAVHRSIVDTYQDDFAKYARRQDLMLMQKVFRAIPRQLGKKIKYSNIDRENRSAKVKEAIQYLVKARVCHQVFHSHCNGVPLQAEINENAFKLIFMDIGLANHICGLDWLAISSLNEQALVNEGGLAEQFIGQHLANISNGLGGPELTYWLREGRTANAEVDYVVSVGNWVVPVEVKAGKSGSLKSLFHYANQKPLSLAVRFDLNQPSIQLISQVIKTAHGKPNITVPLLSLPLFSVETLSFVVEKFRRLAVCSSCGAPTELIHSDDGKGILIACATSPACKHLESIE